MEENKTPALRSSPLRLRTCGEGGCSTPGEQSLWATLFRSIGVLEYWSVGLFPMTPMISDSTGLKGVFEMAFRVRQTRSLKGQLARGDLKS